MIRRSIGVIATSATLVGCLTQAGAGQGYPSGRIAYLSARDGQQGIFVMNADGSGLTQLTHDGQSVAPAWSGASTCR